MSEQKKEEDKEKTEFPRIPYSVEMKLLLWDLQEKKDKEFTIVCEISTDFSPLKQQSKKEPEKPNKEEPTPEQPAGGIPPATRAAQNNKTAKEIIRVVDASGKVVYEAEKTEDAMKEIQKLFGRA